MLVDSGYENDNSLGFFASELDKLIPPYAGEDRLRSGSQGILVGCISYGPGARYRKKQ